MALILRTVILLAVIAASGCRTTTENLRRFDAMLGEGRVAEAADFSASKIKVGDRATPARDDLLWLLQAGKAERLKKNYRLSNEFFHRAEGLMSYYDESDLKIFQSASALLVNDTLLPYYGNVYDGIMVNTYKALNYMALGETERARVEFNRATDRQRRATEHFAAEIAKIRDNIASENELAARNMRNTKTISMIEMSYPELRRFEPYPDFVNPFTSYIAGLFFYLDGDYSKAEFLLRQSAGMISDNRYVLEDMENVMGRKTTENKLWVVFENGLVPTKEEYRIDLPLFIATNQVQYIGIALPKLRTRRQAAPYLTVSDGDKRYNTAPLASMDRVVQTEFEKGYGVILARALASATTKAVGQYALYKQEGSLGALVGAIYTYATTEADLRIWSSLPKDFHLLRIDKPDSRTIKVFPGSGLPSIEIELPEEGNSLLYVRMVSPGVLPVWELITF